MKIFAHRGFSHKYPEATRAAYEGALLAGADGFECDVRLTRDGVAVCFHDRTLERIAGLKRAIARTNYEELVDITEVMRLTELVDLARTQNKELLIETKHPVLTRGRVEREVLRIIKGTGVKAIPMSFSLFAVLRLKRGWDDVAYVISRRWRMLFIPTKRVAIDIELFAKSKWVRRRLQNKTVFTWTVNDESYASRLHEWKIAGVITDRPDLPFQLG